jgi:hypothetical protein
MTFFGQFEINLFLAKISEKKNVQIGDYNIIV